MRTIDFRLTLLVGFAGAAVVLASDPAIPAAGAARPPEACSPRVTVAGTPVPLPQMTMVDVKNGTTVSLTAIRDGDRYCYIYRHGKAVYADAPVLEIHNNTSFSIALHDRIPETTSAETMAPMGSMQSQAADRTAQRPQCERMKMAPPTPIVVTTGMFGDRREIDPPLSSNNFDTNIHTHGLRVKPIDDDIFASSLSTTGQTCVYTYHVPGSDRQPAGTYWYHSHEHGVSEDQVGGGLAGALLVTGTKAVPNRVLLIRNLVVADSSRAAKVLRLQSLALRMSVAAGGPATPDPECPIVAPASGATMAPLNINGVDIASEASRLPYVAPTGREVWAVVNATINTYLRLQLIDAATHADAGPMHLIAHDGVPLSHAPSLTQPVSPIPVLNQPFVLLPPGGRADLIIDLRGRDELLQAAQVCTGSGGDPVPSRSLVTIRATKASGARATSVGIAGAISTRAMKLAQIFDAVAKRHGLTRRTLAFTEYADGDNQNFYITQTNAVGAHPGPNPSPFAELPFRLAYESSPPEPHPNITVSAGSFEEWTLENYTDELHAFHIHQLSFIEESSNEQSELHRTDPKKVVLEKHYNAELLDTVTIPYARHEGNKIIPGRVKLRIYFDKAIAGTFVYHCHMLDHEDHGMMGIIKVTPFQTQPLQTMQLINAASAVGT